MQDSILLVGSNHKYSSEHDLGKVFSKYKSIEKWIKKTYKELKPDIFTEKVILATCNRIEVYTTTNNVDKAEGRLKKIIGLKNTYSKLNQKATNHLFNVSCGIDSAITGEVEILGQIKNTYQQATKEKVLGPTLHELFKQAISLGKLARTKTRISQGSATIGNIILSIIQKELKKKNYKILVIGAGNMAGQIAKQLSHNSTVTIANRTQKNADLLAKKLGCKTLLYEKIQSYIVDFDIVISAVSTSKYVITKEMIRKINKKVFFIDFGVPENIDPEIKHFKNLFLYKLNFVQEKMNENMQSRKKEIDKVKPLIEATNQKFWKWYANRSVVPIVHALYSKAYKLHEVELSKVLHKLKQVTPKDKEIVSIFSKKLMNKFLSEPVRKLKKIPYGDSKEKYASVLKDLFELN